MWWNNCSFEMLKHALPCLTATSTRDFEKLLQLEYEVCVSKKSSIINCNKKFFFLQSGSRSCPRKCYTLPTAVSGCFCSLSDLETAADKAKCLADMRVKSVWGMSIRNFITLCLNLVSVTDLKINSNSTQFINFYNSLVRRQSSSLSPSLSPCRSSGNLF